MSKKLALLRKQVSFVAKNFAIAEDEENVDGEEGKDNTSTESRRDSRMKSAMSFDGEAVDLRKKASRRRHRTSLGVLEDIIKCPICRKIMQMPRMLPCQHTFCKKCLESTLIIKSEDKENVLRCPECKTETQITAPENLPTNLSVESFLKAVDDGSFVEARPQSLQVNFAPLAAEVVRRKVASSRCSKCETAGEPVDACQHCNQVFCRVCEVQHVAQLKDQFDKMIDQLRVTSNKLDNRVVEFKEKTDNLKNTIAKEIEAKISSLREEKTKRLSAVDELRTKGELSAAELKQRIAASQAELARQRERFDGMGDDKEKINKFLELHRNATEMIASALNWQTRADDMLETKSVDVFKPRIDKENSKIWPKQVCDRIELQRPAGIAMDPRRGEVYVACEGSVSILVFDYQYRLTRKIHHDDMMAPHGIAYVESLQEIFVTDKWRHKIYVFNRKGAMVREIGRKGRGKGELRCPEGIAVLQSRNWIYVADTGNDRIQILGVDGTYKGGIGPPRGSNRKKTANEEMARSNSACMVGAGAGFHGFDQPTDVAVSNTAVVVADCGHNKIKVFNTNNQLMFSIGGLGSFRGLFKSPETVVLDENGNIIVGDSDNGRIQVFSPTGAYLRSYGIQGTLVGHFGSISGLFVMPNNEILVADGKKNVLELVPHV